MQSWISLLKELSEKPKEAIADPLWHKFKECAEKTPVDTYTIAQIAACMGVRQNTLRAKVAEWAAEILPPSEEPVEMPTDVKGEVNMLIASIIAESKEALTWWNKLIRDVGHMTTLAAISLAVSPEVAVVYADRWRKNPKDLYDEIRRVVMNMIRLAYSQQDVLRKIEEMQTKTAELEAELRDAYDLVNALVDKIEEWRAAYNALLELYKLAIKIMPHEARIAYKLAVKRIYGPTNGGAQANAGGGGKIQVASAGAEASQSPSQPPGGQEGGGPR